MGVAAGLRPRDPRRQVEVTRELFVDEMKGVGAEPHVLSAPLYPIDLTGCVEVGTSRQSDLTDIGVGIEDTDLRGLGTWQGDHRECGC